MQHRLWRSAILLLVWVTATSCSASYPTAPTAAPVRLLLLSTSSLNDFSFNRSFTVKVYLIDSDGVYTDVTNAAEWQVSNSLLRVTRIQPSGSFTGGFSVSAANGFNESGVSTVTAVYQGRTDSITVTVYPSSRSAPRLEVLFSGSQQLTPGAQTLGVSARYWSTPGSRTDVPASYSTSDPGVATIDGARITPRSPGKFTLIASYEGVSEHVLMFVNPSEKLIKP
ncbi:MAG: hypothetical protein K2Y23_19145 [Cyanobacteria bacterium]|nr:hypothetical protein [Cyanobacteriota bacterium]